MTASCRSYLEALVVAAAQGFPNVRASAVPASNAAQGGVHGSSASSAPTGSSQRAAGCAEDADTPHSVRESNTFPISVSRRPSLEKTAFSDAGERFITR